MIEFTTKIKGGVPQIHILCVVHEETKFPLSLCVEFCNTLVKQTHGIFHCILRRFPGAVGKKAVHLHNIVHSNRQVTVLKMCFAR